MGVVTGIIVFLLIWWVALFTVLPFGHVRDHDGTPKKANIKKKFLWTTVLSIVIWGMLFAFIKADVISFRDLATEMIEEDYKQ